MSAEMDALVADATRKLEALEAALYGLKQVRGRFSTEDGMVTAEVDSDGALVSLQLTEAVTALPPAEAAQLVIWACRQAAEDAGGRRSEVVAALNESFAPAAPGVVDPTGTAPDGA
ncbi:YbaB/EbfC family DNA-binding protein [Nocardia fusca]|jgi:DNA-binding protein YbaB|uniref:YbaB/EbfC family DNA-binding protein n=1 Tax=Nocardia fusca TaxID=941183 RepID=A0ABV3FJE8_9NOCA